jgi:hypothetical protein
VPLIDTVVDLVAVQVGLELPPFEPPQVQVTELPVAGKTTLAGVVTPLPFPHIVPEKEVSVEA